MTDPFEDQLRRTPPRTLPPEWKAEILGAATAAAMESRRTPSRPAAGMYQNWWTQLWLRIPLPTVGLAGAWGIALLISGAESWFAPVSHGQTEPVSAQQIATARAERQALFEEFSLADGGGGLPQDSMPAPKTAAPAWHPKPRSERNSEEEDRFGTTIQYRMGSAV
jgi:hypothetical protein